MHLFLHKKESNFNAWKKRQSSCNCTDETCGSLYLRTIQKCIEMCSNQCMRVMEGKLFSYGWQCEKKHANIATVFQRLKFHSAWLRLWILNFHWIFNIWLWFSWFFRWLMTRFTVYLFSFIWTLHTSAVQLFQLDLIIDFSNKSASKSKHYVYSSISSTSIS